MRRGWASGLNLSGIVNEELYWKVKYKIAWILKETNSEDPNFEICSWLDKYLPVDKKVPKRVALASYGILNNETNAYALNPKDYKVKSSLREIAWINISDEPGGASTSSARLNSLYKTNQQKVLSQIKQVKADIIIFGGTCSLLWNDLYENCFSHYLNKLGFFDGKVKIKAYLQENNSGPLLVETSHPAERSMMDCDYASQIIMAVRAWEKDEYKLLKEW